MRYIYKHGNQFWYQRAIPVKVQKIIGKTSIKISLRTNKISTAVQRSKLQALEHKKMFNEILNKPNYFSKVFNKKKIDTKKYELSFFDEYEDLVNNIFFSKKHILKQIKSNINKFESKTLKYNTIENLLFNIQDNSTLFSIFLKKSIQFS